MFKMLKPDLKCALIFFFLLAFLANPLFANELKHSDLNEAAQMGLPYFLNLIPENDMADYGFSNKAEFKKARLGTPYEVYTFTGQFLNDASTPSENALEFVNEIRFPVMVGGVYRTLLTVAKIDTLWRAVGLGGALLSKELQAMESNHKIRNDNGPKVLLRYLQGKCDFVMVKEGARSLSSSTLYPVNSGATFLMSASSDSQLSYTIDDLKSLIHQ